MFPFPMDRKFVQRRVHTRVLHSHALTLCVFRSLRYQLCRHITNGIGSDFRIVFERRCLHVYVNGEARGVPPVYFDAQTLPDLSILSLDGGVAVEYDNLHFSRHTPQELMLVRNITHTEACIQLSQVDLYSLRTVVGMYKGEYYIHDGRFLLQENTVEHPLEDGGSQLVQLTKNATDLQYRALCVAALPNFLNEANCRLSPSSTDCASERPTGKRIRLDRSIFGKVYRASGKERLLFSMIGLRLEDSEKAACSPGAHSRWVLSDSAECDETTSKESKTKAYLRQLLESSTDSHPFLRDIVVPVMDFHCEPDASELLYIRTENGACWKQTHRSNYQVYDFTEYVGRHAGGDAVIRQFAVDGNFTLSFPETHKMSLWYESIERGVIELGRLGDTVAVHESIELQDAFEYLFGDDGADNVGSALICGSPYEISNDKLGALFRGAFDAVTPGNRTTSTLDLEQQRTSIWLDIALNARDQLRQKVAWILSQILVVSPSAIEIWFETEVFVVSCRDDRLYIVVCLDECSRCLEDRPLTNSCPSIS